MRRAGFRRFMDRKGGTFKIQITSMVDMFVILLVFLLKSYSTSPIIVDLKDKLRIPSSTTEDLIKDEMLKLIVAKDGIYVENKKVMELSGWDIPSGKDDALLIEPLFKELEANVEKAKNISKVNEEFRFDGKILMQADRDVPYPILQRIMYTSSIVGYSDFKIAAAAIN